MIKNNPKTINAWAMYDWANSVYSLVICSAIFPIYYTAVTTIKEGDKIISDKVMFLGREFVNTALSSYAMAFSFLMVCILSPLLSSIADYKGNKKSFLQFFCLMGSVSCACFYFFQRENLELGIFLTVTASVGFWGSLVYYNAYLPEICDAEHTDRVSAKGFSLGYIGSSILMILCLVLIMMHDTFGLEEGLATRLSFVMVGIWWFGFAQYTFANLPKGQANTTEKHNWWKGFGELKTVFKIAKKDHSLKTYLLAFFFYSTGVQTIMLVAVYFGDKLLKLAASELIITVLIIQFVAIAGSYLFAFLSKKYGNRKALSAAVFTWIVICIAAWFIAEYKSKEGFYVLAFFVGMIMGGIQSLSRATYSKLIPETEDHASFFSFYDITEKLAIIVGMTFFGFVEELTGSMQNSTFVLTTFFVIGLVILSFLKDERLKPYKL